MPTELVAFNGSQFVGKPALVDIEFAPALEKVNRLALDLGLQVHVTSAVRKQGAVLQGAVVMPASRSNHLVGHAIDMNLVKFGSITDSAITSFQEQNGLEPDGIVGSDTREALKLKS